MSKPRKGLLVYPQVPENTYWSLVHGLRLVGRKANMPPLGLITVAALFPGHWDLTLVDMNVRPLRDRDIRAADAVFLSAMIVQKESFAEVAARCRRLGVPVVAGGPYPTWSHDQIPDVDHFVLGEAEEIFPAFLADWEAGQAGKIYAASQRPDMARSVVPRFDLLDMRAYATMGIQLSRGCPNRCEFCDIWKFHGNRPRLKETKNLLAEMEALYGLGWRDIVFFVDDNFIGDLACVKDGFMPALLAWQRSHDFPFSFFTQAAINLAQEPELMEDMALARFTEVFIGIETPCEESLLEMKKVHNLKGDMRRAVQTIQEHGIEVMAGFILGYDADTPDIAERLARFIQEAAIPKSMMGVLMVLPGTDLYARLEKEGRILRLTDGNNTACTGVNFVPKMGEEALKDAYRKVMAAIYDRNMKNYFDRCNRLLDTMGRPRVPAPRKPAPRDILMVLHAMVRQTLTPYGLEYVKYLARNYVKNHANFPYAFKLGLTGHHFHAVTRQILLSGQARTRP